MEYLANSPQRRMKTEYHLFQPKSIEFSSSSPCLLTPRSSKGTESSLRSKRSIVMHDFGSAFKTTDGLDFVYQVSGGLQVTNINEKELLHDLNYRFAAFTEKVRVLENQNITLEQEIEELRTKKSYSLTQLYDPEIKDLRKLVHEITLQKRAIEVEHRHLEQDVGILKEKCEVEARQRLDAEDSIMTLKMDINDAYLSKQELDQKVQSLVEEIIFLKKNHQEEVSEMMAQLQEAQVATVRMKDFAKADITAALRDIRKQLEGHASCDIQQTEECFRAKLEKLTETVEINKEALQVTKEEIQENRRQLQHKTIELEIVKGTKEGLENQLNNLEERHDAEIHQYQRTIRQLEYDLKQTKCEMSGHLREYQDLLNVKMALDVEIASYRKLLEGEETRLSSVSDAHISAPYVYRQSPIYTLPCLSKHSGTCTKAEPQFKFVEEIITETTREVEMTEIEGTESEQTNMEEPIGMEEESIEEDIVAQMVGEEHAQTAEKVEKTPDMSDMEKMSAPKKEEESQEVKGQDTEDVFPEETKDEPGDKSLGEMDKVECAEAKKVKEIPDAVETVEPLKKGSAEKEQDDYPDTGKADDKEIKQVLTRSPSSKIIDGESPSERHEKEDDTEVSVSKSPQQEQSKSPSEKPEKEESKPEAPPETKAQEKETQELERHPEETPVRTGEDKVPKVESITAQGQMLEGAQSPEKITKDLSEVKVLQQPQDTDSCSTSQGLEVLGPAENKEVKSEPVKEAVDSEKLKEDSSSETTRDKQETPLNTSVIMSELSKEKVVSPPKHKEDSGATSTMAKEVATADFKQEPADLAEDKSLNVTKPDKTQSVIAEEAEKKTKDTNSVTADEKADKDATAEKLTKEPEGIQKTEATPLPKEESKRDIQKVDTGESTDHQEREKKVEDIAEEPTSKDKSTALETAESKEMKVKSLDSKEEKDKERTTGSSEGDQTFKEVDSTKDSRQKESKEQSDLKGKEDSVMFKDEDPKIEENGFCESESPVLETTSTKVQEVKV